MKGKTVVVTGGTSGIGKVAAEKLAKMGARIVLIARDKPRAEATLALLRQAAPDLAHTAHYADLSRISEMKQAASAIAAQEPRIDVLLNNAGALFGARRTSEDGLELTFALNHMSYFVVTELLLNRLAFSAPARIINTSSRAHQGARLDFDDLQMTKRYGAMRAYCRSKLCNILFTRELAGRIEGTGVTVNCLHPGFVATRFADEAGGLISSFAGVAKLLAISPEDGADTIVYLASSPEAAGVSGQYFYKRRSVSPSAAALDRKAALELWKRSAALSGLDH
ncbi:SDR family oxidoreductase [Methylocapsa palsarum]|uniref:NAD(P)-dependent dehydrogenase, short-chain alcohol dehydrogenase family n=1 Tax=Methylocapsa palsarum TaxID=1612308 RepID=A0A1I3YDN3_9HYPH|nr:SDR family oxidoreductase [Methylocapsa palsarum]SFK29925.1 NAD(P)-dependent dehydrogenase, short-chain alcohol dehydrogenase family [Methylocapsa palsarum]